MAPNPHFEFNQFLIRDKKNVLIHAGKAKLFSELHEMVQDKLDGRSLDYIVFSHIEADETGALSNWLEVYPNAEIVANKVAQINLTDFLERPGQVLKDGEVLDLGQRKLQLVDTPHFPHNWDAHMWYEQTEALLFSSDFCCQGGICEPIIENDISTKIIEFYDKGKFIPYGKSTNDNLEKLSQLELNAIVPMHGSVISGPITKQTFDKVRQDLIHRA